MLGFATARRQRVAPGRRGGIWAAGPAAVHPVRPAIHAAILTAAVAAVLVVAPRSAAQPGTGEPDASGMEAGGYYIIDAEPVRADAELGGPGRFSGVVPLAIPGDITGSFQLDVTARGYEDQRLRVDFPGGAGPLSWRSPRPAHAAGVAKALLWPGLAEIASETGDAYRGYGFATAGGAGVIGILAAWNRQGNAEDDLATALEREGDTPGERADLALAAAAHGATAEAADEAVNDWIYLTAAAWGSSLLDTYFLTPGPGQVTEDLTELRFRMQPLARSEAVLRSLVPGLGQYYAGRRTAGQIAFFSGLAAVSGLLMAEHSYDEAVHTAVAYGELYSDPLADPEQVAVYRTALDAANDTADSRQTTRNIMAGITAGVWVANLIDAYFGVPRVESAEARRPGDGVLPEAPRLAIRPHVSWPERAAGAVFAVSF